MTTLLLTGESGVGKTSVAGAVARNLIDRRAATETARGIFGVISLRRMSEKGVRTGIRAWLCPYDSYVDLAVVEGEEDDRHSRIGDCGDGGPERGPKRSGYTVAGGGDSTDYMRIGPWRFSRESFRAVNAHLRGEVAAMRSGSGSIALIDEVGPLELRRNSGFIAAVEAVVDSEALLLLVIRPSLVGELSDWISERSSARRSHGIRVVRLTDTSKIAPTVEGILGMLDSL
jgi:nucleoside-triphosphatase THEP1